MKFSTILAFLPLALAAPFEVEERTAATVLSDLKTIGSKATAFNTTLNTVADNAASIPGNTLLKLEQENTAIVNAINAATKAAQASATFTKAQSKTIITEINSLYTITSSVLSNVDAHKVAFSNSGTTSLVISDLKTQKSDVAKLGTALQPKAVAPYKAQAPALEKKFATAFTNAINGLS